MAEPSDEDAAYGCPRECPAGLFGNDLGVLAGCENHRSDRYGKSGMVYWARDALRLIALAGEVRP